ncbi:MAG: redoxin domain-containing protein [Actinophytocola sp.]|nr:redoxin domain-containing protein [Actinophytocola sp.]
MKRPRVLALVLLLALLPACSTGEDAVVSGSEFHFVAPDGKTTINYDGPGRQSLELSGEDLFNEGETISTADFAGKVVVINIWGQWCGPCRREAPAMQEVYDKTKDDGVQVLGIDVRDHSRQAPQDFLRDRGLTYPSIYDPPGRSLLPLKGYPRSVVPSTIVLDKQHRVAVVFLKELLAEDLLPVVTRLAKEQD